MPKAFDKTPKITYPPGCKDLSEELSKDELVRRLKLLARAFQDMGQDENNEYKQLALYLASEFFLDHQNKDVRLLVACCVADIFRIFAPEAPYTESGQLKEIFMFLTQQLRGLEDPEAPSFKRYFYLLENLAWVKSFNICIELEENQEIFCSLYKLIFGIASEKHSNKVVNFMLDMMCPLIAEADSVSQELMDIIMGNIIEPYKRQNIHAYNLAKDLLRRTSNAIEPYIQTFFNNALMLGKSSESEVSGRLYELIYELNTIAPNLLLAVLPQLEFKLKSSDAGERKTVTRMLARMFSDPDSDLAMQNKPLWVCFVGRFNDIDVDVRRICVQSCQEFVVNHPELCADIIEPLKQRQHDPDESVRMDVIQSVVAAAKREFANITPELLDCVKERILDKKFKIRKEALMGLGLIYKRLMQKEDATVAEKESLSWIRNKILHAYYRSSLEDRILVERLLNTSLVPYSLEAEDRMKRLYVLFGNVDDHAVKALQEVFKTQCTLRNILKNLLELHQKESADDNRQLKLNRAIQLARQLPEPQKAQEYMKKFNKIMAEDPRVRSILLKLVSPDCTCKKAEDYVKEVLKKMGNPIPQNHLYTHVKMLLERVAPVMIDSQAILALMKLVDDSIRGLAEIADDVMDHSEKGLKLLLILSTVYPGSCQSEEIYTQLIAFIKHDDDIVADLTLQIFEKIGGSLDRQFPNIYSSLLPIFQKFVKIGTPKQAKHAIRCIDKMCKNKRIIFSQIFEHLQKNMDLDSPNFLTSLVGIGHMAQLCPGEFATPVRGIVSKFIVKDLLMQDRTGEIPATAESWCDDRLVSEESQAKVQALKMVVRWLLGLKNTANNSAASTFRLLYTLLLHDGDLMERGKVSKAEMARMRLQAGCCILKLAQEPVYSDLVTLEQFQSLALLLNDSCFQVRVQFSQKLHKGLVSLRLPLQFLSIFCLAANDPIKERRIQCKNLLTANITKRRDFLKQHSAAMSKLVAVLPEYVMPFTIHLLAHDPDLSNHLDVETLKNIRECLWFMMEPLIKSENYSFSFYKKMLETIKQTKDAQMPDSDEANFKLYAVCDLALNLVLTKTGNLVLKDFPAEPVLPKKLFTDPDPNFSNQKVYLPQELMIASQKGKKVLMAPPLKTIVVDKVNGTEDSAVSETKVETFAVSPNSSLSSSPKDISPPVVKKRGRKPREPSPPPEEEVEEEDVAEEEEEDEDGEEAEEESDTETAPAPRGRGRPPLKKEAAPPTRGRGRPKGSFKKHSVDHSQSPDEDSDASSKHETKSTNRPNKNSANIQGKKSQGKITDFISKSSGPGRGRPSLSSPGKSSKRGSHRSPSHSKSPQPTGKENANKHKTKIDSRAGRPPVSPHKATESPSTRNTRKRGASAEQPSPTPKRSKLEDTKPSSRGIKNLDKSLESDKDAKSSPRKSRSTRSPSPPAKGSKRLLYLSHVQDMPSPQLCMDSPTTQVVPHGLLPTKPIHTIRMTNRSNVRRATAMVNGTSDGEDNTPDSRKSSSPTSGPSKTRAAALAKAIQEQGDAALNIKRKTRAKKR